MRPEIPLEVLGLVGPILAWVEGTQSPAIPKNWLGEPSRHPGVDLERLEEPTWAASSQERNWLLNELPTFSLDNVDEVVEFSRGGALGGRGSDRWQPSRNRVDPPPGYDLWHIFETLHQRYLIWNGGKVAIQTGRMVELHELGLRMPLGVIVRHAHARAVAAGEQHLRDVAELPEAMSLLPSNSHGLRTIIRRGLSEGHLHLNSIHATEVAWADHLSMPIHTRPRRFEIVEWRLLRLGRASVRLLALATAWVRAGKQSIAAPGENEPSGWADLLRIYDCMYFASESSKMKFHEDRFYRRFREVFGATFTPSDMERADHWEPSRPQSEMLSRNRGRLGLLHWLDPHRLTGHWQSSAVERSYVKLQSPVEREESLALMHLAAHLALIETPRKRQRPDDSAEQSGFGVAEGIPRWRYTTATGSFLHRSLFRYLVCQTHHWHLGVQQGRTTGLRQFKKYFDSNQRRPVQPTDHERADAVMRRVRSWRGLRVLEGRVSPPGHSRDLLPWLTAFAARAREGRVEKFGLVVHFIKEAEGRRQREALFRARFAQHRSDYRRQAFDLFRILEQQTLVTPFIVGIDAANLELATPPEVFAPVFRFLRDRPIALRDAEALDLDSWPASARIREMVETRRLGMTYHVGEEFRHLLSGLRAIDEVLEFLAPRSGDRIGHGIALGLDPKVWLDHIGHQALVPKQEWLDTLVWVHQLLGAGHDTLGRLGVEEQIEHLGRELYLGHDEAVRDRRRQTSYSITPLLFRDVWLLRQLDPEMLEMDEAGKIDFRDMPGEDSATWRWNCTMRRMLSDVLDRVGPNAPIDLLSRYWYSRTTRQRGEQKILIDMEKDADSWLEVCRAAQRQMQRRVAEQQIAVEVNPSANRIIGPMSRYADHHVFKLTFDEDGEWKRWLRVTVNTDNPGTANTSLTHELYLLGEALIDSGVPEPEVAEWLEWLRRSGEESSFVRQLPEPKSRVMRGLTRRLRTIRRPMREIRDPDTLVRELWRRWPARDEPGSP